MKYFAATLSLLALLASANAYAESPPTLRLDFFHTGNHEMEVFSVDEIVIEPLPWPGNLQWPIDSTSRGKYLFEVIDPESQDILYSRSFSSIYGEWETTAEATKMNRTFHESLRFPKPDSVVTVVLKKRGAGNVFEEIWRIPVDPDDYMNHKESAQYAEQLVAVHESGDPAEKVDLLLLGDGYTAEEQKAFIEKARELTESCWRPARSRSAPMTSTSGHWRQRLWSPAYRAPCPTLTGTHRCAAPMTRFVPNAMS